MADRKIPRPGHMRQLIWLSFMIFAGLIGCGNKGDLQPPPTQKIVAETARQ